MILIKLVLHFTLSIINNAMPHTFYILHFNRLLRVTLSPVHLRVCHMKLSMHVKILEIKNLLKMCGQHIRCCLVTFRPIALQQLNSLTTLETSVDSVSQR